jgi:pyridoxal phosphate enzyme (YggS family)
VTKGFGVDAARAALAVGLADLGENYADELVAKAEAIAAEPVGAAGVRWHFHGTLQTNKINRLAPHVHLWQTVDSPSRAAALASRVPGARVLVQVDFSGRPGRAGCDPAATDALVRQARDTGLDVRGLMCVAPLGEPPERAFAALRRLADGLDLAERSMGMSGDFEEAVRAGATMIRLGSVLFGARPGRPPGSTA